MWIRTAKGHLCNLARATDVLIVRPEASDSFEVRAHFDQFDADDFIHDDYTLISAHATRAQAFAVLDVIGNLLIARTVVDTATPTAGGAVPAATPPGEL